jgi:hypothetical protein
MFLPNGFAQSRPSFLSLYPTLSGYLMLGLRLFNFEWIEFFTDALQRIVATETGFGAGGRQLALVFGLFGFLLARYAGIPQRGLQSFEL